MFRIKEISYCCYPFGMRQSAMSYLSGSSEQCNFCHYKGKELQTDFDINWYDYGARFYDPQLGRFHTADLMAGQYYSWSPYHYTYNNPIRFIAPNGMEIDSASQEEWDEQKQNVINKRDKLQNKVNNLNAKAAKKGWSTEKPANKIGNKNERIGSLNRSIVLFTDIENSDQVYSLNNKRCEVGGLSYDNGTGNIVINYTRSTSNVNRFGDITPTWVQRITLTTGRQPYTLGEHLVLGYPP